MIYLGFSQHEIQARGKPYGAQMFHILAGRQARMFGPW